MTNSQFLFEQTFDSAFRLFNIVSLIIPIVFLIVILIVVYNIVMAIKRGRSTLDSIISQAQAGEREEQETPKSVSAMTSIYLPILQSDFPDLNYDEFKNMAVSALKTHLSMTYSSFHLHRTELYRYTKSMGTCTAIFQSAVEYHSDGHKNQTRYNTYMTYVQNSDLTHEDNDTFSSTCPNCGAPNTNLGSTNCEYCGSAIIPINVKVWKPLKFEEV